MRVSKKPARKAILTILLNNVNINSETKIADKSNMILWGLCWFNITDGEHINIQTGVQKNMTLKKSSTIICLTIQLLLNIVCMILVYMYVTKIKIPVQLYVGFEFLNDLYLSFAGYLFFLLLIVFNIITIICIVSEIINLKNKNTDNSSVKRIIIIPLVFIFCFPI